MTTLEELLSSWDTSREIIEKFIDDEYDLVSLKLMTERGLEILIPRGGPRMKFLNHLQKYINSSQDNQSELASDNSSVTFQEVTNPVGGDPVFMATVQSSTQSPELSPTQSPELSPTQSPELSPTQSPELSPTQTSTQSPTSAKRPVDTGEQPPSTKRLAAEPRCRSYDLRELLSKDLHGKMALNYYIQQKDLTETLRDKVADAMIQHELKDDPSVRILPTHFSFLADEVVKIFPTECRDLWAGRSTSGGTRSRGKLQTKYYTIRRALIKNNVISPRGAGATEQIEDDDLGEDQDSDLANADAEWLKQNVSPWQRAVEKWKNTHLLRKQQLKQGIAVHEYMIQYLPLKDPQGHTLLETDFELLYPGKADNLYLQWPAFSSFVLSKADHATKTEITESLTEVGKKVKTILALNKLFPVVTAIKKKKIQWRPSRQESKDALILLVKTTADIKTEIDSRRIKYAKYGLTISPQVALVGDDADFISACYVVVNDIMYEVESLLKAFDVTFKAVQALDCEYSRECAREWLFIQRGIYGIETKHDKKIIDAKTLAVIHSYNQFKTSK